MDPLSRKQRVDLFMSLLRGREDVFALRWQKAGTDVSGYAPVFTDRSRSTYKPITRYDIENHLLGNVVLGVYPLLPDASSHFIVADFDKKDWRRDAKAFYDICQNHGLPVALEISRSGNGAHVWCFFETSIPASKTRRVFLSLLRKSGCIGDFESDGSFDRLFPNQDMHSGKGLGNLIALPLQGASRKEGKTVFVDLETFEPFPDQWAFLSGLGRAPEKRFDELCEAMGGDATNIIPSDFGSPDTVLRIELFAMIRMLKRQVPRELTTFLREELNFFNSEYAAKSKIGFSTHGIEKFFKTVFTDDDFVYVPRGFIGKMTDFLRGKTLPFDIIDRRTSHEEIGLGKCVDLYGYQAEAVGRFVGVEQGILVAPPGSGKTVMGLALALATKQPTLILTHRQNIADQWAGSIQNFLGIPKKEIGRYGGATKKIKTPFTVAMMPTLARAENKDEILGKFGCVIVDECHHVPAKLFREVVSRVSSRYLFGLTATPTRKHNDRKLITAYLGDVIHEIPGNCSQKSDQSSEVVGSAPLSVKVLKSDFSIPYEIASKDFSFLHTLISFDIRRNTRISEAIQEEVSKKRKTLVIVERKEHIESLRYFLRKNVEVIVMTGTLSTVQKRYRMTRIQNGTFQVVLATGQFFGEGVDVAHFDSLFLVAPISFEGKLVQYMGRLRNGDVEKRVFDIRDPSVDLLEKCFKKRMTTYNRMMKSGEIRLISENEALF